MKNPRPPSVVVRGLYKLIGLLAAVTLQQIHRIYGYCVASNVVLVHGCLLNILFRFGAGPPLYTGNHTPVITQYVVVTACHGNLTEARLVLNRTRALPTKEVPANEGNARPFEKGPIAR